MNFLSGEGVDGNEVSQNSDPSHDRDENSLRRPFKHVFLNFWPKKYFLFKIKFSKIRA
jgi:hypothetical protein